MLRFWREGVSATRAATIIARRGEFPARHTMRPDIRLKSSGYPPSRQNDRCWCDKALSSCGRAPLLGWRDLRQHGGSPGVWAVPDGAWSKRRPTPYGRPVLRVRAATANLRYSRRHAWDLTRAPRGDQRFTKRCGRRAANRYSSSRRASTCRGASRLWVRLYHRRAAV